MSLYIKSGVFLVMVAATVLACRVFQIEGASPESGLVIWLPSEIPGCVGERGEISAEEKKWLPEDTTQMKMVYKEVGLPDHLASYRALSATLILAGEDHRSLHRPEVCLPAQGWTITKREVVPIETKGGRLEVMDLFLTRFLMNEDGSPLLDDDGKKVIQRAHYFYWWVGNSMATPHTEVRNFQMVFGSIFTDKLDRWGYPSVMVWVDERLGDEAGEEEARGRARAFIRDYAPRFQKSLGAQELERL